MDYEQLDLIVSELEEKYMMSSDYEDKKILALTQFYRIQRALILTNNNNNNNTHEKH